MSQIIKNLFLGSYKEARNRNLLLKKNIKAVVVCANHLQQCFPKNFEYLSLPLWDVVK